MKMTIIGEGGDSAVTSAHGDAVILTRQFGDGNVIHYAIFAAFSTRACRVNSVTLPIDAIVAATAPCHRENGDFGAFILAIWRAIDVLSIWVESSVSSVDLNTQQTARRTLSFTGCISARREITCRAGEVDTTGHTNIILYFLIDVTDNHLTGCIWSIGWVASFIFGARWTGDAGVCSDRFVCIAKDDLAGGVDA